MAFDPERYQRYKDGERGISRSRQQIEKAIKHKPTFFENAPSVAMKAVQVGLETLSVPLELVGESIRVPVEYPKGAPAGKGFRAPTLFQRLDPSMKTEEPPSIGVDVANKLIRAGAAFANEMPNGVESAKNAALRAYQADRGVTGTVEDTAAALLLGKVKTPTGESVLNLPYQATGNVLKKGTKTVGKGFKKIGQKGLRTLFGPTEKQQSTFFRRPMAVREAKDFDELADEFAGTLNRLSDRVDKLDDAAWDSLLKLKSEPRSKIINVLKKARREFVGSGKTKIGDADRAAVRKIDEYINRVNNIRQKGIKPELDQMLDQHQLREIVQSVRRDAKFGGIVETPTNLAAKKVQGGLNNLLRENGNYAEIMDKHLAPATKALKEAASKFRFKTDPRFGYVPTDSTAQKLSSLSRGLNKKPETKKTLKILSEETGEDFIDKVNLTAAKEAFSPGDRARGSARTLIGALGGLALEPVIPGHGYSSLIGAGAGRAADVYGGVVSGKIIDAARNLDRLITSQTSNSPLVELIKKTLQPKYIVPTAAAFSGSR